MQTTEQLIEVKQLGKYKVTDDDISVFTKLLKIWNTIIEIDVRSDIKLYQEYVETLSKLNIEDQIILSYHDINLEILYTTTSNYLLPLYCTYNNPNLGDTISDIQARCTVTKDMLNEYQLPQLLDIIAKAKTTEKESYKLTYGQYNVTHEDITLFKKILCNWELITKRLISDDTKLCQEYIRQLSELKEDNQIITSLDKISLELLYNLTMYYSISIFRTKDLIPELELEKFKTLVDSVTRENESIEGYAKYFQNKRLMNKEREI